MDFPGDGIGVGVGMQMERRVVEGRRSQEKGEGEEDKENVGE